MLQAFPDGYQTLGTLHVQPGVLSCLSRSRELGLDLENTVTLASDT